MSINQLIAAAISEPGTPLDSYHRSLMEDCFQTSFRDVRLHFSNASQVVNQTMGSLAFALGNHICFRRALEPSLGKTFSFVLAHELCHVMQQRLGTQKHIRSQQLPTAEWLEREADLTAISVLRGEAIRHVTPDAAMSLRKYGLAGHYYTAFYTAVATGFEFSKAEDIAFFTQMPDLVAELDGKTAGLAYAEKAIRDIFSLSILPPADFNPLDFRGSAIRLCWQIEAGLHALTGGDSHKETTYRTGIVKRFAPGSLGFGLAVHAFGDSFAHRVIDHEDEMYAAYLGHAVEAVNAIMRGEDENDPTAPDWISKRPPLYLDYGKQLYTLFSGQSRDWYANQVRVDLNTFLSELQEVTKVNTESGQIELLLAKALKLSGVQTEIYRPPAANFPWEIFRAQAAHLQLDPAYMTQSLQYAADWAGSIQTTIPSLHLFDGLFEYYSSVYQTVF